MEQVENPETEPHKSRLFLTKMQKKFSGGKIASSTKGAEAIGYPQANRGTST